MSKTSSAVKRKYNNKTYDTVRAYVKKGQLAFLKDIATEHNTSVSSIVIDAVTKYLDEEYKIDFNDFPAPVEEQEGTEQYGY
ncbi:MAG: hypothetical protein IKN85_10575 [Oscillospiraceae bacterium]|nr:hypothetical protein [Oscillospiraceae bacterium]